MIFTSILKIFFWFIKPFAFGMLIQSFLLIMVHVINDLNSLYFWRSVLDSKNKKLIQIKNFSRIFGIGITFINIVSFSSFSTISNRLFFNSYNFNLLFFSLFFASYWRYLCIHSNCYWDLPCNSSDTFKL